MPQSKGEIEFRAAVRSLIAKGKHPDHLSVRQALGKTAWGGRSGLSREQTRWRKEEMEEAGYDWESSKKARKLVPKTAAPGSV